MEILCGILIWALIIIGAIIEIKKPNGKLKNRLVGAILLIVFIFAIIIGLIYGGT